MCTVLSYFFLVSLTRNLFINLSRNSFQFVEYCFAVLYFTDFFHCLFFSSLFLSDYSCCSVSNLLVWVLRSFVFNCSSFLKKEKNVLDTTQLSAILISATPWGNFYEHQEESIFLVCISKALRDLKSGQMSAHLFSSAVHASKVFNCHHGTPLQQR